MITVNTMGEACPIPVIKTKKVLEELKNDAMVEVLVDNEIAVQNLGKLAARMGFACSDEKLGEGEYSVRIDAKAADTEQAATLTIAPCGGDGTVVVIASETMGDGDDTLGRKLMQGFIFALSQRESLPKTMLFYNGGAKITAGETESVKDLLQMQADGVEILTCGTCLNHYGLTDSLKVGGITNMYEIVERMAGASLILRP